MYNLTNVSEFTGASVLPQGDYHAVILDAEATKSKAGSPMIKITLDVNGTKLYEYLTLDSQNQKSYNISMSKAKSILMATGCTNFSFRNDNDLADAMVGDLMISVDIKIEEYQGEKKEKNVIKKFSPMQNQRPVRQNVRQNVRHDSQEIPF